MLLILTEPLDIHADHVVKKLKMHGVPFVRFHPADFPTKAQISFSCSPNGQTSYILHTEAKTIELNQVKAVWYRRPRMPVVHSELLNSTERDSIAGECQDVLDDVWNSLDCLFLPAPRAVIKRAQMKASQLKIAGALGFELPPTLITNSPEDLLEFYRQHNGQIISKLAGFSFFRKVGTPFCRYTEVVSKQDIGYFHDIRYSPMIFQAYVPKQVELRVIVVGQQVFAAEIHSQISYRTRHDWRRYDRNETPYLPHALPLEIAKHCIALVNRLELCYGAIDMVLTPEGRYIFLEINPNGQYLWIEYETGLPISDAICDLLLAPIKDSQPTTISPKLSLGA
ncbi:MAG: hypothetical protein QNJ63_28105 [Calothrix sp. MO_192.B10]|nr:hypothetical protein [Calothrix sp. MO_192.B10]